jgi:hypothetical protein
MQKILMVVSPQSIEDMKTLKNIIESHDSIKYIGCIDVSNNLGFLDNHEAPSGNIVYCIEAPEHLCNLDEVTKGKVAIGEFSAYFEPAFALKEHFNFGKDINKSQPDLLEDDVLFKSHIAQLKSSKMPDLVVFDQNCNWVPMNKQ